MSSGKIGIIKLVKKRLRAKKSLVALMVVVLAVALMVLLVLLLLLLMLLAVIVLSLLLLLLVVVVDLMMVVAVQDGVSSQCRRVLWGKNWAAERFMNCCPFQLQNFQRWTDNMEKGTLANILLSEQT